MNKKGTLLIDVSFITPASPFESTTISIIQLSLTYEISSKINERFTFKIPK